MSGGMSPSGFLIEVASLNRPANGIIIFWFRPFRGGKLEPSRGWGRQVLNDKSKNQTSWSQERCPNFVVESAKDSFIPFVLERLKVEDGMRKVKSEFGIRNVLFWLGTRDLTLIWFCFFRVGFILNYLIPVLLGRPVRPWYKILFLCEYSSPCQNSPPLNEWTLPYMKFHPSEISPSLPFHPR